MNRLFIIGNLTKDVEVQQTSTGVNVSRFTVAVNRNYKSEDGATQTDFFDVRAWRGLGETVAKYCRKGMKVAVIGSVEINHYDDANGNRRTVINVTASDVEFLSSKADMDKADPEYEATHRVPVKKPQYGQKPMQSSVQNAMSEAVRELAARQQEPDDITDEDIPF